MSKLHTNNPIKTTKNLNSKNDKGFIALTSVIIIMAVLLLIISATSVSTFFGRFDALASENKRISFGLSESCINVAVLEIAKNPNMKSTENPIEVTLSGQDIDKQDKCKYEIEMPEEPYPNGYDSDHKKTAKITASAHYPEENGSFSRIEANFTVYDPGFSPPSRIVVKVYSYGDGAKAPEDFGPFGVGGTEVQLGQATIFDWGTYEITEDNPDYTDYDISVSGDCTMSGLTITLSLGKNDYKTCNIIHTLKPKNASLTVIISSADGTMPPHFVFNGTTYDSPQPSQKISIPANLLNTNGSTKDFSISIDPITGYNVSKWAGSTDPSGNSLCSGNYDDGIVKLKKGDNIVCAIAFSKQVPPPDTVLMLDRTGSMDPSGPENYLPSEIGAANTIIGVLDDFLTKIGVGVFGAPNQPDPYNATILQGLTTTYPNLYSAVASGLSCASGYTNLQSAINTSQSAFPNDGKKHSIVLVSDGVPNRPGCSGADSCTNAMNAATAAATAAKNAGTEIYAIHFGDPTGYDFLASLVNSTTVNYITASTSIEVKPTNNRVDSGSTGWSNPSNAYSKDGVVATDTGNHKHRYYNFTDSSNNSLSSKIPSGSIIKGIEVYADASVTSAPSSSSTTLFPSSPGNYNYWVSNTSNASAAMSSNDGDTSYIDETDIQSFTFQPANIPSGATNISVTLNAIAKSVNGTASMKFMIENGANQAYETSGRNLATSYTSYSWAIGNINPLTNSTWSLADLNGAIKFGVQKTNNGPGIPRVTQMYMTVNYTTPTSDTACKLGIDLSWDNGNSGSWTSQKTQTLTNIMSTLPTFGSSIDTWGHTWTINDFSNSHFIVRVQDVNPGSGCSNNAVTNLDWLHAKVYYETTAVDVYGENHDGDHFYISPTAEEMAGIFKIVGEEILAPSVGQLAPVLVVVTQVNNSSKTDNKNPEDFTININNPNTHSFTDDGTGTILNDLNPGEYIVTPSQDPDGKYTFSTSSDCAGSIDMAETRTCVIIYTANPPPPPPVDIQQNIDINSWQEVIPH